MYMAREKIIEELKENVLAVFFIKADGSTRELKCSLKPEFLPKNYSYNEQEDWHERVENQDVIACWGVHENAWRSFRVDSVTYIEIATP